MSIFGEYDDFVAERVRRGDVVLVLGAGANYGSHNQSGERLKDGAELAEYLTGAMGYDYKEESLTDVAAAYINLIGRESFNKELKAEFLNTRPSHELNGLFRYSWRRVYTWNIDDALIKSSRRGIQQAFYKNGMSDKVDDHPNIDALQIIYLHGQAQFPDEGLIFSERDYAAALQAGGHPWYSQLVDDYRLYCPIFIGSALKEPILSAELERASLMRGNDAGLAFLVTPDELSPIRIGALKNRHIVHVKATIAQFLRFIHDAVGPEWSPQQVISRVNRLSEDSLGKVTKPELAAAQFITPVSARTALQAFQKKTEGQRALAGRRFLTGFPPDWEVVASDIPVTLSSSAGLRDGLKRAVEENKGLFITLGPAGSGKSTATMQAILELSKDEMYECYELSADVDSFSDVISVLSKINDKRKIVFLPVLYVFGGALAKYIDQAKASNVTLVTTARSSEWGSHLERVFAKNSVTFDFKRFSPGDYAPLIDRLSRYVPAPRFMQLSTKAKIEKLKESKNQLLIALREATESKAFDEIILDEYEGIKSSIAKEAFLRIGVATMARVGLRRDFLLETFSPGATADEVNDALRALDGIIYETAGRRLFVRHDVYARNVLASLRDFGILRDTITSILRSYLKFKMPIMRNVSRQDGALFRFLFNHDFVYMQAKNHGDASRGREIYAEFEVPFQLDGHFWLQYGLFVSEIGEMEEAIDKLKKSIDAFPGNFFARHALASAQLRFGYLSPRFDKVTRDVVGEAVATLREMDADPAHNSDHYPIVTLATRHISVLVKHGQEKDAQSVARDYLAKLQRLEKFTPTQSITNAKEGLVKYLALGTWTPPELSERIVW